MKPPTAHAMEKALSILMSSVHLENLDFTQGYVDMSSSESIDFHIMACEIAFKTFQDRCTQELAAVKKERNDFALLHGIPRDVLAEVFALTIEPLNHRESLHILGGVCRYWRQVMVSSPRFWKRMDGSYPPSIIATYLRRSMPEVLDIDFDSTSKGLVFPRDGEAFARFIAPHANRYRSLRFRGRGSPSHTLIKCLKGTLGSLIFLQLELADDPTPMAVSWIIPSNPILQTVLLRGIRFRWSESPLKNLKSLTLISVQLDTMLDLVRIISQSPGLEILVLSRVTGIDDHATSSSPEEDPAATCNFPINLPHLQKLHISSVPRRLSHHLFRRIHTLLVQHLHADDVPLDVISKPYSGFLRTICYPIRQSQGLEILLNQQERFIRLATFPQLDGTPDPDNLGHAGMWIQCASPELFPKLDTVVQTVRSVCYEVPVHFAFSAHRKDRTPPSERNAFTLPSFPPLVIPASIVTTFQENTTTLKFHGDIDVQPILQYLSQPLQSATLTWPALGLEVVDFGNWDGPVHDILRFVAERWGDLHGRLEVSRPKKLEKLVLPPGSESVLRVMRHAALLCVTQEEASGN